MIARILEVRSIADSFDDDISVFVSEWEGVGVLGFPIWTASQVYYWSRGVGEGRETVVG